jgi:hypothetical protein
MHKWGLRWKPPVVVIACMRKRSDRHCRPKSNYHEEASMNSIYYIGLDIYKKVVAYCIKRRRNGSTCPPQQR